MRASCSKETFSPTRYGGQRKPDLYWAPTAIPIPYKPTNHVKDEHGKDPGIIGSNFRILKKCQSKLDCSIFEMLVIRKLQPILNKQSDSIRAKLFTELFYFLSPQRFLLLDHAAIFLVLFLRKYFRVLVSVSLPFLLSIVYIWAHAKNSTIQLEIEEYKFYFLELKSMCRGFAPRTINTTCS